MEKNRKITVGMNKDDIIKNWGFPHRRIENVIELLNLGSFWNIPRRENIDIIWEYRVVHEKMDFRKYGGVITYNLYFDDNRLMALDTFTHYYTKEERYQRNFDSSITINASKIQRAKSRFFQIQNSELDWMPWNEEKR